MLMVERFQEKIKKTPTCWTWIASIDSAGYGRINIAGKSAYAHRIAWELAHERHFPEGLEARHICNNRACVNPEHIIAGTNSENQFDAVRTGTHRGLLNEHMLGEKNWRARLRGGDIDYIRNSSLSQRKLGTLFGVTQHAIWCVKNNKTWNEICKEGRQCLELEQKSFANNVPGSINH